MRSAVVRQLTSGRAIGTLLVIGALLATLTALLLPLHTFGGTRSLTASREGWEDDGMGTMSTPYGPLSALDRDFVRKVRLAGLWEGPAGREAEERGSRETVRTAGSHLVEGHMELDKRSVEAGRALGVDLANQPNRQQRGWLSRLAAVKGDTYDRTFANVLRRAHGKVFALIGLVRDKTRNSMVRSLASRANAVVLDHITVLEDTGLVDFDALNRVE
ncbi:DUF4142 domain-containing protein [Streptomyces iconiensis]|uniref:DUF4142 domain-containing protein n=1 Tax=Streptomyces iconiensis TaxID=1384038 RepID=A0ABT6ZTM1_9ACTN|nr:DUF4142 domain-containing protein [Streptomyces iconiensis]MDJ1132404.1 DUF4142 domain-containing protein [Streptomyces iconiensis]